VQGNYDTRWARYTEVFREKMKVKIKYGDKKMCVEVLNRKNNMAGFRRPF